MNIVNEKFQHRHAAHCESGVASSMLTYHGVPISEAMAFGLSSAMAFAYLPFVKFAGFPLIAYRMPPKHILKGMVKPFKMRFHFETFREPEVGTQRLDELLQQGKIVGIQTSAFWLPYFPADMRFHFNAHNLIVYGKEGDEYLISDPVAEDPQRCASDALQRARFATGLMAPKGLLYYPETIGQTTVSAESVARAIRRPCAPCSAPCPSSACAASTCWPTRWRNSTLPTNSASTTPATSCACRKRSAPAAADSVSCMPRSCRKRRRSPASAELSALSERMNEIGDGWREFALKAARMIKGREPFEPKKLAEMLHSQAEREKEFFQSLKRAIA